MARLRRAFREMIGLGFGGAVCIDTGVWFQGGVAFMIDALFWYTGLAAWVLIVFGCVSTLAIEAHDRSVMGRGRDNLTRR